MRHSLKEVLLEKGMTQKELAEKAGFTEVGISKMVNSGTATKSSLDRIAKTLNVDFVELVGGNLEGKAKYEGSLKIGNIELSVAVLDNGTRIIRHIDVFRALGRPARGNARVIGIPAFMDAKNIQPFVNKEVKSVIRKIDYIDLNGKYQTGFDCLVLPTVCDIYLKLREEGLLTPNQVETAQKAEMLIRALAKTGIIALVDEATGYDKEKSRAKNELQKYLDTFLRDEAAKWVKTFNDQFFEDIYKMRHWTWTQTSKRPGVVGTWIKDIVYDRLGPILTEIEKLNPKNDNGNRGHKHFQFLSDDIGLPRLKQHLEAIHAIAVISNYDWSTFTYNLDKAYPRKNIELFLDFGDEEDD